MDPVTLVVTDLDGTLLNSRKNVTPRTRLAIQELKKHGILFGIASGRPVESGLLLCQDWGLDKDISFLIGMNGGVIYDMRTKEKEAFHLMDGELAKEIIDHFKDMDVIFQVMVGNDRHVSKSTEVTRAHAKVFGENEILTDLDEFLTDRKINKLIIWHDPSMQKEVMERAATFSNPGYTSCATADNLYEYFDPNINKGFGLQKIEEHYGVARENVVAFGDNDNDIQMLDLAGFGVAMKNASERAKEAANIVLEYTNDEDGLAEYINKEVLKNSKGYILPHPTRKI